MPSCSFDNNYFKYEKTFHFLLYFLLHFHLHQAVLVWRIGVHVLCVLRMLRDPFGAVVAIL